MSAEYISALTALHSTRGEFQTGVFQQGVRYRGSRLKRKVGATMRDTHQSNQRTRAELYSHLQKLL